MLLCARRQGIKSLAHSLAGVTQKQLQPNSIQSWLYENKVTLTQEADLMGTVPGMSLFPAETEHRAGQAGSSQPEPQAPPPYMCPIHTVLRPTRPSGQVLQDTKNPQARQKRKKKKQKKTMLHASLYVLKEGPFRTSLHQRSWFAHKHCTQRSTCALSL